ncbi:hypothetical protein BpHYR1_036390 [Brachionus plicatilis]|uniref:Uncharacterized protein n=1 Tax=Brachionus plicatilis TaxID=10195 RepID=A0A3M7SPH1_BRAPC|nr:hypothetical protein BpHYR1_036390 [Brachionus plicatilis]
MKKERKDHRRKERRERKKKKIESDEQEDEDREEEKKRKTVCQTNPLLARAEKEILLKIISILKNSTKFVPSLLELLKKKESPDSDLT